MKKKTWNTFAILYYFYSFFLSLSAEESVTGLEKEPMEFSINMVVLHIEGGLIIREEMTQVSLGFKF